MKNGTKLSKREFLLQKWGDTVWSLKRFIKIPNLVKFFENSGDPTKILDQGEDDLKKLGVIYEQGAKWKKGIKLKDGVWVDNRERLQQNMEASLRVLQELEKNGKIMKSSKYGRIVIDEGGKMGGLGSQMCRDLGYDGYVSFKESENSFMVWTRKPLEETFDQGFNVREFMWVKKTRDGDKKVNLNEICKKLSGKKKPEWSSGLILQAIKLDDEGEKEKSTADELTKRTDVLSEYTWYDGIGADLWYATMVLNENNEEDKEFIPLKQEAIKRLKNYFPDIDKKILGHERTLDISKLHWASRALKEEDLVDNPWSSKALALDYLRQRMKIDKSARGHAQEGVGKVEQTLPKDGTGWKELMAKDRWFLALQQGSRPELWAKKLAELEAMNEDQRNVEMGILRGLVAINSMATKTAEFADAWQRHKVRLKNLGWVV